MASFPALTGFYKFLFLYLEPFSTTLPALMILTYPGASWFYHELIPSDGPAPPSGFMEPRATLAIWQLGNCYLLLGMVSTVVFRAVRDAVPRDLAAQERLVGALLSCLAFADVTHVVSSFIGLPVEMRYNPAAWNPTTHGNISFTVFLFLVRISWFLGIARTRYYFGVSGGKIKSK
ncbi:hypothetical protein BDZ89DRAFT_1026399 [Hymenopellis radicata]|nr:hypothetical protein BDZ89DRAFT_1026399 [Hymenopellis radicata]